MKPLHILLRQYRVLAVILLAFFGILTWDMWEWFQGNYKELDDNMEAAGVFSSLVLLSAGALKWGLENVMKRHDIDDHYKEEE